ncbi:hypothetical protein BOTBODRAFT_28888 [Botryobasidium botryosum FD-172 SS1]|uniref:Pyridoxamine 5'-phosphate oxidase putative domain-containing protein n=1 Tax=Botryobasidium botryosum (strain FD-172 SS1) TaxID=930990 RepID=A0A067MUX8_BOTB1|nr:hypothetical protein BOTBODRAFT_28888 [Botryobasidium botryosum FD-172 SS1]
MDAATFDRTPLNTVRRHPERAEYDRAAIAAIVRDAKILHVAFNNDSGDPQCIPMLGAWDEVDGQPYIYFHAYHGARFIKTLSDVGTPICATATIVDGYVLSLSAFGHSLNYRSAVIHGVVLPLAPSEDEDAFKMHAFKLTVQAAVPDRWDHVRQPTPAELRITGIIRMKVDSASAKIRRGPPKEDRKDLEDAELVARTWTGVVPVSRVAGTPEPSEYCRYAPGDVPAHVSELR